MTGATGVVRYVWPGFVLALDVCAGTVVTTYACGRQSGGPVVFDDAGHAEALGISALQHRLAHELAHHVVALALRRGTPATGCPIVHASAHGAPMPADAQALEHAYTAVTYLAYGVAPRAAHGHEWAKLGELHDAGVDVRACAGRLRWLLDAIGRAGTVEMTS